MLFEKQLDSCIKRCEELLKSNPNNVFITTILASALLRQGKTADAIATLRDGGSIASQLTLVQVLLDNNDKSGALDALFSPILHDLRDKPAFVSLVVSLQGAEDGIKTVLEAQGRNPQLAGLAGVYFIRRGKVHLCFFHVFFLVIFLE